MCSAVAGRDKTRNNITHKHPQLSYKSKWNLIQPRTRIIHQIHLYEIKFTRTCSHHNQDKPKRMHFVVISKQNWIMFFTQCYDEFSRNQVTQNIDVYSFKYDEYLVLFYDNDSNFNIPYLLLFHGIIKILHHITGNMHTSIFQWVYLTEYNLVCHMTKYNLSLNVHAYKYFALILIPDKLIDWIV